MVPMEHTQRGLDITIGRAPDNTVVLDDPLVSRHHTRLVPVSGGYQIHDLHSLNGIQLNGRPAPTGAIFSTGDRLTIGRTNLQISNGEIVAVVEHGPH